MPQSKKSPRRVEMKGRPGADNSAALVSSVSDRAERSLQPRLFEGLSTREKDSVLAAASHHRFERDSVAAHQGDRAERLFLLISGSARYFFITPNGKKVYLLWLAPGEVFGCSSLLPRTADFIVSTEIAKGSEVIVWRRDLIRNLAEQYPRLLENALSTACDYLVWYVATHLSLICDSARRRLAHVLVSLTSGFGQKGSDGISLEITNEELANTANITLFTASRLLSEWHRKGVLVKGRGKILLRHPERLFTSPAGKAFAS
jgi:CRP/FNR family transcriptional regulator, nitrogen oxide reductase regulator